MTKKKEITLPEYAINPLFNSVKFEWFPFLLNTMVPKRNVNLYLIKNCEYQEIRKEKGKFQAMLSMRKLMKYCEKIKGVLFIAEYEDYEFFVVTENDITDLLLAQWNDDNHEVINMGAAASKKNDNPFTLIDRSLKALTLAQKAQIPFQAL